MGDDEALKILRRLEPALAYQTETLKEVKATVSRMDDRVTKLDERQRGQGEGIAELKGRLAGIEAQIRQLPTLWTIASLVVALFGAAFVLLRFALPNLHG